MESIVGLFLVLCTALITYHGFNAFKEGRKKTAYSHFALVGVIVVFALIYIFTGVGVIG